jgi:hypothetical protein
VNDGESKLFILFNYCPHDSYSGFVISNTRHPSGPTEVGMKRLALAPSDKSARDWFVSTTQELGCETKIDEMGNIFAIRPGLRNDRAPTYAGSHLDTQPSGGRYDGILGVTAGIEMLRVLKENWVETEFPVGVINWTKYVCLRSIYLTCLTFFQSQRGRRPIPNIHGFFWCVGWPNTPLSCPRP